MRRIEFGPKFGLEGKEEKSKEEEKELKKIEFRRETEKNMEEAVRKYGINSEEWPKEYKKYLRRLRRHKYEWGYPGCYHQWLEINGFKLPLNEELIQKMRRAKTDLGTDSAARIGKSKYRKDYVKIHSHKELGYKNWEDFLTKGLIPREIKDAILEKYKFEETVASLNIDVVVDRFLEEKYPERKARVEKKVVKVLDDWQEGIREKLRKEIKWPY